MLPRCWVGQDVAAGHRCAEGCQVCPAYPVPEEQDAALPLDIPVLGIIAVTGEGGGRKHQGNSSPLHCL